MKKIAVTGGLSSGKTSVCHVFKRLGAHVVSADEVVHSLLSPNTLLGQEIVALLSEKVVKDGTFDRTQIAKEVFSHPQKLAALERLLHPEVLKEIEKEFQKESAKKKKQLFVVEIPLLYESESEKQFDSVVAVISDKALAKERFQDATEFEKRMARQIDPHQKAARADYTIHNSGTFAELETQVNHLYQHLISKR